MGAIDDAVDALDAAESRELFIGETDTGHADNGIQQQSARTQTLRPLRRDCFGDGGEYGFCAQRLAREKRDLRCFYGGGFLQREDRACAGAVGGAEVEQRIAWCVDEVAQEEVYAACGIGDEDDCGGGCVEEGGEGVAGGGEQGRVLVADEVVDAAFGCILEVAKNGADGARVGAEGAWRWLGTCWKLVVF